MSRDKPVELDLAAVKAEVAGFAPVGLESLVAGPGALGQLPDLVTELLARPGRDPRPARIGGPVVVLAAGTPILASSTGPRLRDVIDAAAAAIFPIEWVLVGPAGGSPHADEATVTRARAAAAGAACVITVGSGTLTDIGKAAAPPDSALIAVQTATSVNGYADPFSVLLRDGVKRTTPSRWPDALIIDPAVLGAAPAELNRAGLGDMAAMFTAAADWYLASAIGADGPAYQARIAELVRPYGERMLTLAGGAGLGPDGRAGTGPGGGAGTGPDGGAGTGPDGGTGTGPDGGQLTELGLLLTRSGIAMGVAGSTAPASGMEHAVSHLLEMAANATGADGNPHGTCVGVASIVAAATWAHVRERIAAGALTRPGRLPDPDQVAARLATAFAGLDPSGAMAAECLADYAVKLRSLSGAGDPLARLRDDWDGHEAALDGLLTGPAKLAGALRRAGLPVRFADLPEPVGPEQVRWAVANCALQRRRFGVADLAMLLGAWEDADIDAVLAAAQAAAGRP